MYFLLHAKIRPIKFWELSDRISFSLWKLNQICLKFYWYISLHYSMLLKLRVCGTSATVAMGSAKVRSFVFVLLYPFLLVLRYQAMKHFIWSYCDNIFDCSVTNQNIKLLISKKVLLYVRRIKELMTILRLYPIFLFI